MLYSFYNSQKIFFSFYNLTIRLVYFSGTNVYLYIYIIYIIYIYLYIFILKRRNKIKMITVKIENSIYNRLKELAKEHSRTLTGELGYILNKYIQIIDLHAGINSSDDLLKLAEGYYTIQKETDVHSSDYIIELINRALTAQATTAQATTAPTYYYDDYKEEEE